VAQFRAESVAHFTAERVVHLPQNTQKLSDLERKGQERRHVKELEKQRDDKRRHLFEAQDQI
jgi:hypothetical protein